MSKHKMVDERLLQMNKSYGQLKQRQMSIPEVFPSRIRCKEIMIPETGNQPVNATICCPTYSRLQAPPAAARP